MGYQGCFWGTCIEGFDDLGGTVDVQEQVVEPAMLPQVQEDPEAVPEGGLGLLLPLPGLVRVVLGAEPGNWGKKRGKRGLRVLLKTPPTRTVMEGHPKSGGFWGGGAQFGVFGKGEGHNWWEGGRGGPKFWAGGTPSLENLGKGIPGLGYLGRGRPQIYGGTPSLVKLG